MSGFHDWRGAIDGFQFTGQMPIRRALVDETGLGHDLKCWPEHFGAILAGFKAYEARPNDRDFKVGDRLLLREWNPESQQYTGRQIWALITHALYGPGFGIADAHAVLGLGDIWAVSVDPLPGESEEQPK